MLSRIEVRPRPDLIDAQGRKCRMQVREALGVTLDDVKSVKVFTVSGLDEAQLERVLHGGVLHDPVLQEASRKPFDFGADWVLEVSFRPGVTDNEGRTARESIALVVPQTKESVRVYTAVQYHFFGKLDEAEVRRIGNDLLANGLIQSLAVKSKDEWRKNAGFPATAAQVTATASGAVETLDILAMSDSALETLSRENTLALSLEEMHAIQKYYARPEIESARKTRGVGERMTDAELEVLAQTWSEHCKHKIFAARVEYTDFSKSEPQTRVIKSLYKTCIQGSTKTIRAGRGEADYCKSVFKDNAGVVQYAEGYTLCIKAETHNSPSALDPYGGALTGIVGVNRDPMGTGMGADLLCNTDVFCVASPFYSQALPPRLLHPRRVLEGVRLGVEDGGNKSGIPTVNGSVVFDERFLGKPLVFCGTVGIIPETVAGHPGYEKKAGVGDVVVMAGGRIGKDGIHGATFSSEELHEGSPATAVQIGDPITQRKLYDFIRAARDKGLYSAITDNGAGGLSSSVGEMAQDTGGCRIDLSLAPLKYDGLKPWEILLSEAQERMTLAVPGQNLRAFMELARRMDVETTALGEFTDSGYLDVTYGETPVAYLSMDFLHDGVPQMRLQAEWKAPVQDYSVCLPDEAIANHGEFLRAMLGRLNICSKEWLIRQYDHEVKGGSAVKPLVGAKADGPGDAAVLRPFLDRPEGVVLSHGICPKFSDYDTYWMMANALDEAVRNAVAVGADPDRMSGVDNFCWCDPVQSERTPDGRYKMAQLVRANEALAAYCMAYGVPCISGKDSMKNDYTGGGRKISIPPTVLFSVMGFMPDVSCACTSDFKRQGDAVYLLGQTARELAGAEAMQELGLIGGLVPQVDAVSALRRYRTLYAAIRQGLVNACHDLSDGGLGVALAEMALAGRLGATVNLDAVPSTAELSAGERLYSESASRLLVTVPEKRAEAFERLFAGQCFARLGMVEGDVLQVKAAGQAIITEDVEGLAAAFKGTLRW